MNEPQVWRIHLKSNAEDRAMLIDHCINNKCIGIGYGIDNVIPTDSKNYYDIAYNKYNADYKGFVKAANAIMYNIKIGDLIWFRDLNGYYYLCKISSEWEYKGADPTYKEHDLCNIRKCENIFKIDTLVPGALVNSMALSNTVQRVNSKELLNYSKLLWNQETQSSTYALTKTKNPNAIFEYLDDSSLEDLLCIYLQFEHGYAMIPSSRAPSSSTIRYEFEMVNKMGKFAIVQVKGGEKLSLNPSDYLPYLGSNSRSIAKHVFLFAVSQKYENNINKNDITCLKSDVLVRFIENNLVSLPNHIKDWYNWCK
jgi:hypothetical protein